MILAADKGTSTHASSSSVLGFSFKNDFHFRLKDEQKKVKKKKVKFQKMEGLSNHLACFASPCSKWALQQMDTWEITKGFLIRSTCHARLGTYKYTRSILGDFLIQDGEEQL